MRGEKAKAVGSPSLWILDRDLFDSAPLTHARSHCLFIILDGESLRMYLLNSATWGMHDLFYLGQSHIYFKKKEKN